MRAFLAKIYFQIYTGDGLRSRLLIDPNIRAICGFHNGIPSVLAFFRRMKEFCSQPLMIQTLNKIIVDYQKGRLVGHINRDSTAIPVHKTPVIKKPDGTIQKKHHKRGCLRKDEIQPIKEASVLEF